MNVVKFILITAVFVIGWRISELISPDSVALITGITIGALLGIPALLIALWVYFNERRRSDTLEGILHEQQKSQSARFAQPQPQILIVGGQGQPQPQQQLMLPDLERQKRKRDVVIEDNGIVDGNFRVVGDEDSKW